MSVVKKGGKMRLNFTLALSIMLALGIVTAGITLFHVSHEKEKLKAEIIQKLSFASDEFEQALIHYSTSGDTSVLGYTARTLCKKYRLYGVAYYKGGDTIAFSSSSVLSILSRSDHDIAQSLITDSATSRFITVKELSLFQYIKPYDSGIRAAGAVIVYAEAGFLKQEIRDIWYRNLLRWLIQAILVASVTLLIFRWGIMNPLKKTVKWLNSVRAGNISQIRQTFALGFLAPLHKEATKLAEAMKEARAIAEEEVMLRTLGEAIWTPVRLQAEARQILKERVLIVVSNREPYMHMQNGREIKCIVPASGMVTALEPILKACGGLWVATGSGNADKKVVDEHDRISVPVEDPKYTLRRVWITPEEEENYYYGFSNEGLWPLCHIAHTRPVFRSDNWQYYWDVNQKFADAVLEEIRDEKEPFILVQDYHFALLPLMIRKTRPDARISIFWHIPWPNPESFAICPWQKEILLGMLGADLIGFHTQFHCNNFLSTVNRTLEAHVTWETFTVAMGDHKTRINPFPISIAFTMKDYADEPDGAADPSSLLKDFGIRAERIGVGVDRIDYTKGIMERFLAIERFLVKFPEYIEKFTFVQIGAPSRTNIKNYSDLLVNVEAESNRINKKFQTQNWRPILMLGRHHSHQEILPFYKASSLCMVTSLHDGMNLVAKEYIASRNDLNGVLILSRFTGAAQELSGSLIVNPYDIEEMADAIRISLEMPESEQRTRMERMRQTILRNNVYSWAASLLQGMDHLY
jgi:trehalose-6-phosphate synthase